MKNFDVKKLSEKLGDYIVGQDDQKNLFINFLHGLYLANKMEESDHIDRNILLYGGVGNGKSLLVKKTAMLLKMPFVSFSALNLLYKTETEIMQEMIEKLTDLSIRNRKRKWEARYRENAKEIAIDKMIENISALTGLRAVECREKMQAGELDEMIIPIQTLDSEGNNITLHLKLEEATDFLTEKEIYRFLSAHNFKEDAIADVENFALIMIEDIDKIGTQILGGESKKQYYQLELAQRRLVQILDGMHVNSRSRLSRNIQTFNLIKVGVGTFTQGNISTLVPELQSRLINAVRFNDLNQYDFARIMVELKENIIKQHLQLGQNLGFDIEISHDCLTLIAERAFELNREDINLGVRRMYSMVESVFRWIYMNKKGKTVIKKDFVKNFLEQNFPVRQTIDNSVYML